MSYSIVLRWRYYVTAELSYTSCMYPLIYFIAYACIAINKCWNKMEHQLDIVLDLCQEFKNKLFIPKSHQLNYSWLCHFIQKFTEPKLLISNPYNRINSPNSHFAQLFFKSIPHVYLNMISLWFLVSKPFPFPNCCRTHSHSHTINMGYKSFHNVLRRMIKYLFMVCTQLSSCKLQVWLECCLESTFILLELAMFRQDNLEAGHV